MKEIKKTNIETRKQPESAYEELVKLEDRYGYSTYFLLKNKVPIEESIVNKWISEYETYIDFGGSDEELKNRFNSKNKD